MGFAITRPSADFHSYIQELLSVTVVLKWASNPSRAAMDDASQFAGMLMWVSPGVVRSSHFLIFT